ncbi:MAG: PBP1A family penicillin-binding protein [Elusimicrobia bacterium]|nr:PBP1A family penicillin-binding protein [Elusimicrobiota bacterium]
MSKRRLADAITKARWPVAISAVIFGAVFFLRREMMELPQLPQVKFWAPAVSSRVVDRNGKTIFEFAVEKRDYVSIEEIPLACRLAFLSIEDERFYKHWGIDPRGIFRALLVNLSEGRVVQGASTITQQVAKNLFLTREKSLRRKVREWLLAIYIEANLSKEEILEMYLNQVYLGHGVYGVAEGARNFFGKDIGRVTLAEAAMLAGLIKAPANYSPWRMPEAARARSHVVLGRMLDQSIISPFVYDRAVKEEVQITSKTAASLPPAFAHFLEYLRQDIEDRYSPELLWKGGLRIETTIDTGFQERAHGALTQALENFDQARLSWEIARGNTLFSASTLKIEGSFLAMETKTGAILTWIGGRDFKSSQFNRVNQSKRQPGSAFKPFVWLAALNNGATPASVYDDLPLAYTYDGKNWRLVEGSTDFQKIVDAAVGRAPEMIWVPNNFDGKYRGPLTLRRALAASRNLVSIRLVDQATPQRIVAVAKRAGIASALEPVLSLGLGTAEVTLLELTGAYQTIGNLGIQAKPYAIRRITQGATGSVLEDNRPVLSEALPPGETYLLVDMMKSVTTEGTAARVGRVIRRPTGGKTGTTQDNRDLWFVGFTPDVVAGGWMGYDNFEPLGKKDATGGSTVVPWWTQAVLPIIESYPSRDFGPPPEGVVFSKICTVSGRMARLRCPKTRLEVFLKDHQPAQFCELADHEEEILLKPDQFDEILAKSSMTVVGSTTTAVSQDSEEETNPLTPVRSSGGDEETDIHEEEPMTPPQESAPQ